MCSIGRSGLQSQYPEIEREGELDDFRFFLEYDDETSSITDLNRKHNVNKN